MLRLTLAGENQYAIAAALGVSVRCVQNHTAAIRRKHRLADPAAVARRVHELTLRFAVEDATAPLKAEIASLKAALAAKEEEIAELEALIANERQQDGETNT